MMLKKMIVGALVAIVVVAAGFAAYNLFLGTSVQAAGPDHNAVAWGGSGQGGTTWGSGQGGSGGQGRGQGRRGGGAGQSAGSSGTWGGGAGQSAGSGIPNPQNGYTQPVTYHGTVSGYAAPNFTLVTDNGQKIPVQLGNLNYLSNLGLSLQEGQAVSVTGFKDPSGSLAVVSITLDGSGQTYTLRDSSGRPSWAGGGQNR